MLRDRGLRCVPEGLRLARRDCDGEVDRWWWLLLRSLDLPLQDLSLDEERLLAVRFPWRLLLPAPVLPMEDLLRAVVCGGVSSLSQLSLDRDRCDLESPILRLLLMAC